jgi:hypothetical protein
VADRPIETEGPEDPALSIAARHALHDEELIAAFATDGEAVDGAERARSLVERCVACRDLHADLVAIGGMLRAVEKAEAVAATQPAPRDFRLSIETANRLRPGSVALKFRDRLAAAVGSFSRPVGLSMASLGVVGLLLGTLTMGGFANLASAPEDNGEPGAAAAPTAEPGEVTGPLGTRLESLRGSFDAFATAAPPTQEVVPGQDARSSGGPTLATLIVGGSAILLIGGIALLMLGSRRREPVPSR